MATTPAQVATIAQHYLIACIWADGPEGTQPRATRAAESKARATVQRFVDLHPDLFAAAMACADAGYGSHPDAGSAEAAFGRDLYLSTARHGAGFFDRRELGHDLGRKLQDAARSFGEPGAYFYRGWLYL